jgi:hypothetical protein
LSYIIVLNVHAPIEDKTDYVKDNFYEEMECLFNTFSKYHMNILLGYFNAKVSRKKFLTQQFATKVYMKLVMAMATELEK